MRWTEQHPGSVLTIAGGIYDVLRLAGTSRLEIVTILGGQLPGPRTLFRVANATDMHGRCLVALPPAAPSRPGFRCRRNRLASSELARPDLV